MSFPVVFCVFFFSFCHSFTSSNSLQPAVPQDGVLVDVFHNRSIITDHHHIEKELKHYLGQPKIDELSVEELQFYYFTLHDFDKNTFLDGLEILTALEDSLEETLESFSTEEMIKLLIEMTDEVLEKDDVDNDGYLSYYEYIHSQNRTASPTTILEKSSKEKV
ncbi:multiple coagulation factor deficiency protein 2 homolog [Rhincodon typus]|uniref:multiple coagulation factor deficiency protein 2 homolog n=1 Tax=Rhincodon typus TaxID=259920 RepID=UPI002030D4B1|nr:multiple coagulation factor deficiency protein 2 homolog [Rhincodon typus]